MNSFVSSEFFKHKAQGIKVWESSKHGLRRLKTNHNNLDNDGTVTVSSHATIKMSVSTISVKAASICHNPTATWIVLQNRDVL